MHIPGRHTPYGFDLDPGEEITRIIRRHPLALLPTLLGAAGLVFVSASFAYIQGRFPETIPFPPLVVLALSVITAILAGIVFLVGIYVYQRNVLIFTNMHLIQAEQHGLFVHRVSQVHFTRIQDVTGTRHGLLQTLFNYGNVEIQSAGERTRFVFLKAPHPQAIADDALEIHELRLRELGQHEST